MSETLTVPVHRSSWVRFVTFCEQSAALPWIAEVKRLALGAEDDKAYRKALATEERVRDLRQRTAEILWQLEPEWCAEIPALRPWIPRALL